MYALHLKQTGKLCLRHRIKMRGEKIFLNESYLHIFNEDAFVEEQRRCCPCCSPASSLLMLPLPSSSPFHQHPSTHFNPALMSEAGFNLKPAWDGKRSREHLWAHKLFPQEPFPMAQGLYHHNGNGVVCLWLHGIPPKIDSS